MKLKDMVTIRLLWMLLAVIVLIVALFYPVNVEIRCEGGRYYGNSNLFERIMNGDKAATYNLNTGAVQSYWKSKECEIIWFYHL